MTDLPLHEHQVQAVEHLSRNSRAGLFLPMGAGKSLSVLAALTPEHLPALIVAPKKVAEHVWSDEPGKWRPDLSVGLAVGTPAKRLKAIQEKADLTVIGRDNLQGLVSARGKAKYRTIVLDESQSFKTRSSTRWKLARRLAKVTEHLWLMTGTPAGNGLMDLWAQVYLLDQGKRLGETLGAFRQRYFNRGLVLPNGVVASWDIKKGAEDAIYKKLADICLHIPMIGLDLPELTINQVPVELPPASAALYTQFKDHMVADVDMLGGVQTQTVKSAALLSSKLSQITAGFSYGEANTEQPTTDLNTAKLDELGEILDQTEGGVLVFHRFRREAERILERFPQAVSVNKRGAVDAWNRREVPILLAHPASAGHGLNLQYGGNTIVWTSVSWSSEDWLQGNARLHRQGQVNKVMVHVLGIPGTIDDHVLKAVQGKVSVQQALLDALT